MTLGKWINSSYMSDICLSDACSPLAKMCRKVFGSLIQLPDK